MLSAARCVYLPKGSSAIHKQMLSTDLQLTTILTLHQHRSDYAQKIGRTPISGSLLRQAETSASWFRACETSQRSYGSTL